MEEMDKPTSLEEKWAAEAATPDVVEPLIRMIQREDEDLQVIRNAVSGLGRAGDPKAASALMDLMQRRAETRQSVLDALAGG